MYWTDLRGETVLLSQHDPRKELEYLFGFQADSLTIAPKSRGDNKNPTVQELLNLLSGRYPSPPLDR